MADVNEILEAARSLPPAEQLAVLQRLAHSLSASWSPLVGSSADFWAQRSIEDLAVNQGVPETSSVGDLGMPEWPADETADDVIAYMRAQRAADRGA